METRVDKYKDKESKPSRVEKNQELYQMIYSAYDEFENYKVPLEEKEIDFNHIKKNVTNRSEYMKAKEYGEFTNKRVSRQRIEVDEEKSNKPEVYDIKELLSKVKTDNNDERKTDIREEKYLDKLHLKDNAKTNLEMMKEKYEEVILDNDEEEKLSNTANLSLEILSDLRSNEDTMVSPPMKEEDEEEKEIPRKKIKQDDNDEDDSFYSDMYKFKKKDFEEEDLEDEDFLEEGNNKFLFKILILISFIILIAIILIYLIGYFS